MFSERLRRFTRTFRFRLMVWNAFVVVLTAALTLLGIQFGMRRAMLHELDVFLVDEVSDLSGILEAESGGVLQDAARRPARSGRPQSHGHFASILNAGGEAVWMSGEAPADLAPPVSERSWGPATVSGYRLVQRPAEDADGAPMLIRVGMPLAVLDQDLARVDRLAVVVACIALVGAPPLGFWAAGRAVAVLRDIIHRTSRLRPAELAERLPIRDTGDELDQLSRTVNGLLDRIAAHLSNQQDYLANAAHELRTPLAAIHVTAEVALGEERSGEDYREFLADVVGECERLETLVNQLLLLSETESDRLKIHGGPVALDDLVGQAVQMFEAAADAVGVTLHRHLEPVTVEGNAHHLRQVLNNLLDNAIRFTPPGGRVDVELQRDADRRRAVLRVRDTGIGISGEDLPQIFQRFYRGSRPALRPERRRGTGLGLSICRTVVETHGGNMRVESRVGEGSTFTVELPFSPL
jgi:signal transduction histidine kinase